MLDYCIAVLHGRDTKSYNRQVAKSGEFSCSWEVWGVLSQLMHDKLHWFNVVCHKLVMLTLPDSLHDFDTFKCHLVKTWFLSRYRAHCIPAHWVFLMTLCLYLCSTYFLLVVLWDCVDLTHCLGHLILGISLAQSDFDTLQTQCGSWLHPSPSVWCFNRNGKINL